jgi:glycerol kinase
MIDPSTNRLFIVLDQGTSSSKVFLFDNKFQILYTDRVKHSLTRPAPRHIESNAESIGEACTGLLEHSVQHALDIKGAIVSCGLAVQRSTFLFWDRKTLKPLTPAISWQDSRAIAEVDELEPYKYRIQEITGTPLSAHFGAPKFLYLTRRDSALLKSVQNKQTWFGSLSAYLVHKLTGKPAMDESIACRALLLDINTVRWSKILSEIFQIPLEVLPSLRTTSYDYGSVSVLGQTIPLKCVIGDQQAALVGQGGIVPGTIAANFGTSASVQFNTGDKPRHVPGLLSSVLVSDAQSRYFMLEGTINACNALFYWLESELNISHEAMVWEERSENTSTEGVMIPGFTGLAAPYWIDGFDTVYYNLENADKDEIIRAGMESIGFLVYDILTAIGGQTIHDLSMINASGGGARKVLLQFIADLLQIPVGHTTLKDRTALGVYKLLQKAEGIEIGSIKIEFEQIVKPVMDATTRIKKIARWHKALKTARIT